MLKREDGSGLEGLAGAAPSTGEDREFGGVVVSGCTDKQIAARTGLSFSTVRTYVRQVYRRMGVHTRVALLHIFNRDAAPPTR